MYNQDLESAIEKLKPFLPEYLEEHGIDPTKKFKCIFPGHEDRNPSCNVVGLGTSDPRVHCYGCSQSADLFDVVQIFEHTPSMGLEWIEGTLKYLAKKYGVEVKTPDLTEEQIYELDTYRAYRIAAGLIKSSKVGDNELDLFKKAVEERGWTTRVVTEMGVGTVTSYTEFRKSLKDAGFSAAFLDEIDLGRKDIFSPENMIFTWKDEKGRPVGFSCRNLLFEQQQAEAEKTGAKCDHPKYNCQRTTGLKCNIFQKGKRLYGIDGAIHATPPLYIFEGQTDVISARNKGLDNCVAIGGLSLSAEHILFLKDLGIYDVIIGLDGDSPARAKLASILEERFAGHRDMRVRVILLPDDEDPDSFIRKNGIDTFKGLACWTAFEWRLLQYEETDDPTIICQNMIPFIVNESSPIIREDLCKTLAKRTGVSLRAITDELHTLLDAKAHQKSLERQQVVDKTVFELRKDPTNAETIIQQARSSLLELAKKHNTDILSTEECIRTLDATKIREEERQHGNSGYKLGPDLQGLQEVLQGEWEKDVFMAIGGKSNHGKSACLCKIAYSIANYNENVCVIYHSIDDSLEQIVPRFVTIGEGSRSLTINMVRRPRYWMGLGVKGLKEKREAGYAKTRELMQAGKLVVKDITHGGSLLFAEHMFQYYRSKNPEQRIVYILDNFHKLDDFANFKEERVRFKELSKALKRISEQYQLTVMTSMEYTKLSPGIRPNNYNLSETAQLEYDTNFIAHLYSEMADTPQSFSLFHRDVDWKGEPLTLPRVELIIGKNKITEMKQSIFLDFWPACSDYRYVDQETVAGETLTKSPKTVGDPTLNGALGIIE
jgi:DNA primase catalytic core